MKGELATGYVTDAELEVWRFVACGLTSKEIAGRLNCTTKTAGHHREAIGRKIGARNSADFARIACERGVIPITVRPLTTITAKGRTRHIL